MAVVVVVVVVVAVLVAVVVVVVGRADYCVGSPRRKGGGRMRRIRCVAGGVCSVGGRDRAFSVLWEDDVVGASASLGSLLREPIPSDRLGSGQEWSRSGH